MTELIKSDDFFTKNSLPLDIAWRDPQPEFPIHKHQFTELLIVTKGRATHIIDDMEFEVSRGDVFIINAGWEHGFTNLQDLSLVNVIFDKERMGLPTWNTASLPGFRVMFDLEPEYRASHNFESKLVLNSEDIDAALGLVQKLSTELETKEPGFEINSTALFMQLVTFLSRCYGRVKQPYSLSLLRLAESINYIESNFLNEIKIDDLAGIAHMSSRNFQRVFTKSMGTSVRDYIITQRLKYSCDLLKQSDLPITDIAYDSGFNDSNYYSRQFKKHYGITPRQFRN